LGQSYSWDGRNRLRSASGVTMRYDMEGHLVGWTAAQGERKCLFVPGAVLAHGEDVCVLAYGGGGISLFSYDTEGIAAEHGAKTRYVQRDASGSVVAVTDQQGAVKGSYRWSAYGEPVASSGESFLFGYHGEIALGGLVYLRNRWYDPRTKEFLSLEPEPPTRGTPASLSAYGFLVRPPGDARPANGNPLGHRDPSGRMTLGGLSVGMSISSNMRAMMHAAVHCAKGIAIQQIKSFALNRTKEIAIGFLLGPVGATAAPILDALMNDAGIHNRDFGKFMTHKLGGALCNGAEWKKNFSSFGFLIDAVSTGLEFEYEIDVCGNPFEGGVSWDCSYLDTPEAPDFPATPNIGGAIDMLVGDVLPVEFKRTTSPHLRDKVHQMMRLGMFGAGGTKAGGPGGARVVMYVFAGSMEDKEIRKLIAKSVLHPEAQTSGCNDFSGLGSMTIFFGKLNKRYKFLAPSPKDIRKLVRSCAKGS
ncbi:MAG: hypothetical protein KC731_37710, partial [Myxococcales bacterium]|nr:hypothetical protein [Myxococcales bacterium]